jgi:hypothetical protein
LLPADRLNPTDEKQEALSVGFNLSVGKFFWLWLDKKRAIPLLNSSKPPNRIPNMPKNFAMKSSGSEPVAALVSLKNGEDLTLELQALSANSEFMDIIEKARRELRNGKKLSLEEMELEFQTAA